MAPPGPVRLVHGTADFPCLPPRSPPFKTECCLSQCGDGKASATQPHAASVIVSVMEHLINHNTGTEN